MSFASLYPFPVSYASLCEVINGLTCAPSTLSLLLCSGTNTLDVFADVLQSLTVVSPTPSGEGKYIAAVLLSRILRVLFQMAQSSSFVMEKIAGHARLASILEVSLLSSERV